MLHMPLYVPPTASITFMVYIVTAHEYFIQTQVVTAGDLGINAQEVEQNLSQAQRLDSLQCGEDN